MLLDSLPQYHRNARRMTAIVAVFGKYGLAGWLSQNNPAFVIRWFTDGTGTAMAGRPLGERIRAACTDLGPTFIKLGQLCSTRPDLVGADIARDLEHLQASVPADDIATVRATMQEGLGCPLEERFTDFETTPMASASIGQVHRATMAGRRPVVVKVRHADIESSMQKDMEILLGLAQFAERHSEQARRMNAAALVEEFDRLLMQEIDFDRERRNMETVCRHFTDDPDLRLPVPIPSACARSVLTMSLVPGIPLRRWQGTNGPELARIGARIYLDMIFRDRCFHGDPHPGNILIIDDIRIGLIDFGIIGRIDERLHEQLEDALLATIEGDAAEVARICAHLGQAPADLDEAALHTDIANFLADFLDQEIESIRIQEALEAFTRIICRHNIILPSNLALLIKVLVTLDGSVRRLDPHFVLADAMRPYHEDIIRRRHSFRHRVRRLRRNLRDWQRLVQTAPRDLSDIIERLRGGRLDISMRHEGLEVGINRLVNGILAAAITLAGAHLLSSRVPPVVWDISIAGLLLMLWGIFTAWIVLRRIRKDDHPD